MENDRVCKENGEYDDLELYAGESLPLEDLLWEKVSLLQSQNQDIAFFLADLGEIYSKLEDWRRLLPRVEPFFAVKCNSQPVVTRFLADAGVGFDCASKMEIEQILNLGVHPSRIVYANPFKQSSYLTYAARHNVDLMAFDDIHELIKINEYFPCARLILRMATRGEVKVLHKFNNKFGCPLKQCGMLLTQALDMKMNVVGVSFHIGGQPEQVDCFSTAIEDAHQVFKIGLALGFQMHILDIGGGFPGRDMGNISFAKTDSIPGTGSTSCEHIIRQYFPPSDGVRVIAEPGRYFVTTSFTLAVKVIAKKVVNEADISANKNDSLYNGGNMIDDDSLLHMYIINQGIYGIFANVVIDKAPISLQLLQEKENSQVSRPRRSKIFGPTCAGCDCLMSECRLPEVQVGQWFYFRNMGAYSFSLASGFNGIELPLVFPVCSKQNCPPKKQPLKSTQPINAGIDLQLCKHF
ncbi:unnamed protein product [Candidula unifasciata]|uniref:ornithine decarboxylase n=1 Tax=Candidula unifasciata TaxID=100452 RepID=A0A8S3ZI17_9EUPU|nr:unnamed protein product [Candidula unifasciata]